jgi:GT2 family glycosyltransferase
VRTKDRPEMLKNAFRSIAAQTYRSVEVILINDGGCDLAMDELRDILGFAELEYVKFEENRGRASAGNEGIKRTRGEYICFLDDDDEFCDEHLSVLVSHIVDSDAPAAYTDAVIVNKENQNGATESQKVFSSYDFFYTDLLVDNYIPLICILFSGEKLRQSGGFDESFDLYEDWDLILRLGKKHHFDHVSRVTARYNIWSSAEQIANVEGKEVQRRSAYEKIFYKHLKDFNPDVITNVKKKREQVEGKYSELIEEYKRLEDQARDTIAALNASEEKVQTMAGHMHELNVENLDLKSENRAQKITIEEIYATLGWRILTKLRQIRDRILPQDTWRRRIYQRATGSIKKRGVKGTVTRTLKELKPVKQFDMKKYHAWIKEHEPVDADLLKQREASEAFHYRPRISIIVPVYNTEKEMLIQMIESVLAQSYDNWQLCIADGNSDKQHVKEVLQSYRNRDERIQIIFLKENRHIAENSNEALSLAEGEFVGFLDHDDLLAPFALYEVVKILNDGSHIDLIYSDEDNVDYRGERSMPFFKPDWSPDLLCSVNYICHFAVARKKIVDKLGGFRRQYDGAQDYDLFLRISAVTSRIAHIPKILYHWRVHEGSTAGDVSKKVYADTAGKGALTDFFHSSGIDAYVISGPAQTNYQVRFRVSGEPLVSIIIPFRDKVELLKTCVKSILNKTTYKHYELLLVSNKSTEEETFHYLESLKNNTMVKILRYDHEFNFSKINNFAAAASQGEFLLFLNNDTEVITDNWLMLMLEHAQRKETGVVGCKMLFPDKTIQHAGVVLGMTGFAGHVFAGLPDHSHNYFGSTDFVRNYLAVTGACMMIKRTVFEKAGGFNEDFVLCGSDVDLCLRIHSLGYRNIYTPYAVLYHHESVSRKGCPIPRNDYRRSLAVYGKYLENGDPYYNHNLSLLTTDCSLLSGSEKDILKRTMSHAMG